MSFPIDTANIEFELDGGKTLSVLAYAYQDGEDYYATADHYIAKPNGEITHKGGKKRYPSMVDAIAAIASKYGAQY